MNSLLDRLALHARQRPHDVAVRDDQRDLSYSELWQWVTELASALTLRGAGRVGLMGDNTLAWVAADLACRLARIPCVPIPVFFSAQQREHLKTSAGLDVLLCDQPEALRQQGVAPEALDHAVWMGRLVPPQAPAAINKLPDDLAKVTFTSGSTGTPKGVCLTHRHLDNTVAALAERLASVALSRHLCVLPLATLLENVAGVYLPLWLGASVTVRRLQTLGFSGSSGLDMDQFLATLGAEQPDSLILVPEIAHQLVAAVGRGAECPASLTFVAVGGGKVSVDVLLMAHRLGLPFYEGYGLSECGSVVALNTPDDNRPGAAGRPLSHINVTVSGEGELLVTGNTFAGYLGEPSRPDSTLATGDLGHLSKDGYLFVDGRRKNLLITRFGRNINPEWLESELRLAPGLLQSVVIGDNQVYPSALVMPTKTADIPALVAFVRTLNQRLPDYARLQTLHVSATAMTPANGMLTANGRLNRHEISRQLEHWLGQCEPWSVMDAAPVSPDVANLA
ncbi:AMP-binding protein [Marinobacter caseinilyticus]|uniref:AMP-binding protein n=1 Tax=Marinobacter caseinilyticus TaxID=2692195 RepID=UPI0014086295|nr:AMP-binding protein [Marinobacter caseinilyticus]